MVIKRDLSTEPKHVFYDFEEATRYLENLASDLDIQHLSYWLVTNIDGNPDDVVWISTYDPNYMNYYMTQYTPMGDPGFTAATGNGAPIDWTQWSDDDPVTKSLLQIGAKYGIGKFGVSLPYRDQFQNDILFSINVASSEATWPIDRLAIMSMFWPFVEAFNARVWPLAQRKNNPNKIMQTKSFVV